eukprot:2729591-Amphidinium_carterae.2
MAQATEVMSTERSHHDTPTTTTLQKWLTGWPHRCAPRVSSLDRWPGAATASNDLVRNPNQNVKTRVFVIKLPQICAPPHTLEQNNGTRSMSSHSHCILFLGQLLAAFLACFFEESFWLELTGIRT